jgi:hypothetical protein
MSTTNNVFVGNYQALGYGGSVCFDRIWKLSRALKKAGWKYISSSDGAFKDTSGDPAADEWNQSPGTVGNTILGSGLAASVAAPSRGRAIVNGLTGISSSDKGRFLVISGSGVSANNNAHQIEEIDSATQVKIDARTFAVAADAGPLSWEIRDSLSDVYPTSLDTAQAWWCARGPSILRLPITTAPAIGPTGFNFLRGENIVQSTTGAEGELRGYYFDSTSNTGYLVIHPRLRGTGTGLYGWEDTYTVTGSLTGATVTQSGTLIEYRHEIVLWKGANTTTGCNSMGFFDTVADSASMFSSLSLSGSCTATVAPGGGGAGNGFPSYAWMTFGNNTSSPDGSYIFNAGNVVGNAQIVAIDCIEEQNYTADGSYGLYISNPEYPSVYGGLMFMALNDGEDGDLHPYVTNRLDTTDDNRVTSGINILNYNTDYFSTSCNIFGSRNDIVRCWKGWFRRGLGNAPWGNEATLWMAAIGEASSGVVSIYELGVTNIDALAIAPEFTRVRQPISVARVYGPRTRKGTLKHAWLVQGGNANDTYDNKQYFQLSGSVRGNVVVPWDGVTTPRII